MTRGDKIAFGLIAVLLVLAIVFRKDLGSLFDGGDKDGERKEKKDRKDKDDKDNDKKEGRRSPELPLMDNTRTVLYTVRA